MKVVNVLPDSGWTGMANFVVRSRRLTVRARGLLLELLSYPPDNDVTIAKIAAWNKEARKEGFQLEGREALQMAMRELERDGYVVHDKRRDKTTGQWSTTTYVSPDPEAIAQFRPSTALPRPGTPSSGTPSSAAPHSADPSLSTYKTDHKTENKTGEQEGGLQYSSALASARAGQQAGAQDRDEAEAGEAALQAMYEAVRQTDETYLRDRLLKFERKRPAVYRKYRNDSIEQIESGRHPERIAQVGSSRVIDELTMMYAVRHYAKNPSGVPQWLIRFN